MADALSELIVSLVLAVVTRTPPASKQMHYDTFLSTKPAIEEICRPLDLVFPSDLLSTLMSSTPPHLSFFKGLSTSYDLKWGIYVLVFEHPEDKSKRPGIYIGSATGERGIRKRFTSYDKLQNLPRLVKKWLDEGFVIAHKGLLATTDIPTASLIPKSRLLFLAMETLLDRVFGARTLNKGIFQADLHSIASEFTCGVPGLASWDVTALPWDGLCTHSALHDPINGDFDITSEQLEANAAAVKARAGDSRKKRLANDDEYRETYYGEANDRRKRTRAAAVEDETWVYVTCNFVADGASGLEDHNMSYKHLLALGIDEPDEAATEWHAKKAKSSLDSLHKRIASLTDAENDERKVKRNQQIRARAAKNIAEKKYWCELCQRASETSTALKLHRKSMLHLSNEKRAAEAVAAKANDADESDNAVNE